VPRAGPGIPRPTRSASATSSCRTCCRNTGRALRRLLQLLHLWRGRRLAAALPLDGKALVDGGVQHFLRVLGSRRLFRALRCRSALRQDRSARWFYRTVDLGCCLHNALGLCHEQRMALVSPGGLASWVLGPEHDATAEVFPTRIRGVANGIVWFIAGLYCGLSPQWRCSRRLDPSPSLC
jgi:hypothetical protein